MGCSSASSVPDNEKIFGGLVCGGAMFEVAIGDINGNIIERKSFETLDPKTTTLQVIDYFKDKDIYSLGVASFGPIDPDKKSETFGYITTTPKKGWSNFNIIGVLKKKLNIKNIEFDTDVNAACLGEVLFGSAKDIKNSLYLYIGQGIGGGALIEGELLHGLLHPEMGHIKLLRKKDDKYIGHCPYHRVCLEGLADEPSLEERTNKKFKDIEPDDPVWDLEAYYIGQACAFYILTMSPQKILIGGPVMQQTQLFPMIRKYTKEFLNEYIKKNEVLHDIDNYIVPNGLGNDAMIIGAFALAIEAYKKK